MDSQIDMTCINETAKSIICRVLNCSAADIKNMQELSGGNTNSSFVFEVFGVRYVYRQPGMLTENFIDRRAEQFACEQASLLGVGEEILYMDANGIKISKFIEQIKELCTKVVWLDHGKIIEIGEAKEVCDKYYNKQMGREYTERSD